MGRGLSELQKTILRIALKNRKAEKRTSTTRGADVYGAEVLYTHWKWKPKRGCDNFVKRIEQAPRRRFSSCYSKEKIGAEYNVAHASLSRAFDRLATRGLAIAFTGLNWSGIRLTDEGVAAAENLLVKPPVSLP